MQTLDLRSGYYHIALDKDSIRKAAFVAPFGKYAYLKYHLALLRLQHIFKI